MIIIAISFCWEKVKIIIFAFAVVVLSERIWNCSNITCTVLGHTYFYIYTKLLLVSP